MIPPKNSTEDLLLPLTEKCKTLFEQTHRKAEETLEFTLTKSRETFSFNPPTSVEESWMIGVIRLSV